MTNVKYDSNKPLYIVRGFGYTACYYLTQTLDLVQDEDKKNHWYPETWIAVFCGAGFKEMTNKYIEEGHYMRVETSAYYDPDIMLMRTEKRMYACKTKGKFSQPYWIDIRDPNKLLVSYYPAYFKLI